MATRMDIGKKLEDLAVKKVAKVLLHAADSHECNKPFGLSTVAAPNSGTTSHQLIISPAEAIFVLAILPRNERSRSSESAAELFTTTLNLTVAYGDAVIFTAPGFGRDDDMFMALRVTIAK